MTHILDILRRLTVFCSRIKHRVAIFQTQKECAKDHGCKIAASKCPLNNLFPHEQ